MRVSSFLADLLYRLYSDIGVRSLRILNVSMKVWYVYRFSRARILCFMNNGFVCSN